MRTFVLIFATFFLSQKKCTKLSPYSYKKQFEDEDDQNYYDQYSIITRPICDIFGRKGLISHYLFHGKEMEYQEQMSRNYIDYVKEENSIQNNKIGLVKEMVAKNYKPEDIKDILRELNNG